MIRNYALIAILFLSSLSFGQVVIHVDGEPNVAYNGDTLELSGSGTEIYKEMYVLNMSGASSGFKWRRIKLATTTGFTDQLCDDQLCWICSGDTWTRPSFWTIDAADSSLLKPILSTGGVSGSAHYRYYILNNSDVIIDSVDVKFTSTVGMDEVTKFDYKLYPNPANGVVNLVLPEISGDVKFVLYNMVGSEVLRQTVVQGSNNINCESLQNGVYFYSIILNNNLVETKKLIIKH
jgi:hypothetical protein